MLIKILLFVSVIFCLFRVTKKPTKYPPGNTNVFEWIRNHSQLLLCSQVCGEFLFLAIFFLYFWRKISKFIQAIKERNMATSYCNYKRFCDQLISNYFVSGGESGLKMLCCYSIFKPVKNFSAKLSLLIDQI